MAGTRRGAALYLANRSLRLLHNAMAATMPVLATPGGHGRDSSTCRGLPALYQSITGRALGVATVTDVFSFTWTGVVWAGGCAA